MGKFPSRAAIAPRGAFKRVLRGLGARGGGIPRGGIRLGSPGIPGDFRRGRRGAANRPGDGRTRLKTQVFLDVWEQGSRDTRDARLAPRGKSPGFPSRAFLGHPPFPSRAFWHAREESVKRGMRFLPKSPQGSWEKSAFGAFGREILRPKRSSWISSRVSERLGTTRNT